MYSGDLTFIFEIKSCITFFMCSSNSSDSYLSLSELFSLYIFLISSYNIATFSKSEFNSVTSATYPSSC